MLPSEEDPTAGGQGKPTSEGERLPGMSVRSSPGQEDQGHEEEMHGDQKREEPKVAGKPGGEGADGTQRKHPPQGPRLQEEK